ncbi:hypothetical protein SAMN05421796_102199 [Chryseobacterium piscicola]|uniref:Uncharacterized protein n=1 Tax=Chryseobacterium piscicola TaxID=551459 RepID=A0A1N7LC47_9FLAO|nr:hypothetical protein [Chryseobacterium piscicola]PQA97516.1 hypothetical protein B0A70_02315 [Chryseobacterium piscicola]SIS71425.1 hypothetical protein SAMN05421796_102199 [Chryseobacterium piscicola]
MIRKIFAVVGGMIVGNLIIFLIESISHLLYPLPENVTYENLEAFSKYVQSLPIAAKLIIIAAYAIAAFAAGFVSTKIPKDGKQYYAIICGAILLTAIIWNFSMLPTPIWMWTLGMVAPFLVLGGYKAALNKNKI